MKEISLTQGKVTLVDDEDYELVNQYKWSVLIRTHTTYVKMSLNYGKHRKTVLLHRLVLGLTDSKNTCDHIDGNGLNNQKNNLRACTQSQNCSNKTSKRNSTSRYLGVSWSKTHKSWLVLIGKNYKTKYIGRFKNEQEAAIAFNNAAKVYPGEFAKLNVI